jgi:hypothetical protein
MRLGLHRWIALGVASSGLYALPALADTRPIGQTLVYDITQTTTTKVDLSSLPASIRSRAEANYAAANGKPQKWMVSITTDRVDADGGAHVNGKFTNSIEAASVAGAIFAKRNTFGGTLGADGRLMPTYDPSMQMTFDSHGQSPQAQTENVNAQRITSLFADFNTFAAGCAKHGRFKAGDAWRVVIQDPYGISREYDFSVGALDSANGHDAPTISMKFESSASGASSKVTATGHYDGARQLVLDLHEDTASSNSSSPTASSSTSSIDYTLRQ